MRVISCSHWRVLEVGLLTFLQVKAREYFDLTDLEEATLTAVVFAGELIGALFWGPFADKYGRKLGSFFSASMVAISGVIRYSYYYHYSKLINLKVIKFPLCVIQIIVTNTREVSGR